MSYVNTSRAVSFGFADRAAMLVKSLRDAMERRSVYNRTVRELRALSSRELADLGILMQDLLAENPAEMFLIEGHTDAVGRAAMNLALSDRRAESVALALTEYFDIPPENMVVQGYGEGELRIATDSDEPRNRRAVVRMISPLMNQIASAE